MCIQVTRRMNAGLHILALSPAAAGHPEKVGKVYLDEPGLGFLGKRLDKADQRGPGPPGESQRHVQGQSCSVRAGVWRWGIVVVGGPGWLEGWRTGATRGELVEVVMSQGCQDYRHGTFLNAGMVQVTARRPLHCDLCECEGQSGQLGRGPRASWVLFRGGREMGVSGSDPGFVGLGQDVNWQV